MAPLRFRFHTVFEFMNSVLLCTVSTAINRAFCFHAVTDHPAAAVRTGGRQGMDGAFETVENVRLLSHADLKAFVVYVSADFASPCILSFVHLLPLSVSIFPDAIEPS
jgi:hypothetical protein